MNVRVTAKFAYARLGYIDLRLYYIVYVLRDNTRRIISLRKANSREVKRYAQA